MKAKQQATDHRDLTRLSRALSNFAADQNEDAVFVLSHGEATILAAAIEKPTAATTEAEREMALEDFAHIKDPKWKKIRWHVIYDSADAYFLLLRVPKQLLRDVGFGCSVGFDNRRCDGWEVTTYSCDGTDTSLGTYLITDAQLASLLQWRPIIRRALEEAWGKMMGTTESLLCALIKNERTAS